jgi:hypothetical protein
LQQNWHEAAYCRPTSWVGSQGQSGPDLQRSTQPFMTQLGSELDTSTAMQGHDLVLMMRISNTMDLYDPEPL